MCNPYSFWPRLRSQYRRFDLGLGLGLEPFGLGLSLRGLVTAGFVTSMRIST